MKKKIIHSLAILFIVFIGNINNVNGQSTSTGAYTGALYQNSPGTAADYIGWIFGTLMNLDVKNEDPQPINFYTNAGAALYQNQKMTILGTTNDACHFDPFSAATYGGDDGYVGIGNTATLMGGCGTPFGALFPKHRLDVDNGDINVRQLLAGYRLGPDGPAEYNPLGNSWLVLWNKGNPQNINELTT